MKKIIVDINVKGELKDLFNTTYYTVKKALEGDAVKPVHLKIRKAAIEKGGVEVDN